MMCSERTLTRFNIYKIYFRFYILYICTVHLYLCPLCELSPRFPLLSVSNICIHFRKVAILGATGWVYISLFFIFSFNSFEGDGNIQLQNIACFYINQILYA